MHYLLKPLIAIVILLILYGLVCWYGRDKGLDNEM